MRKRVGSVSSALKTAGPYNARLAKIRCGRCFPEFSETAPSLKQPVTCNPSLVAESFAICPNSTTRRRQCEEDIIVTGRQCNEKVDIIQLSSSRISSTNNNISTTRSTTTTTHCLLNLTFTTRNPREATATMPAQDPSEPNSGSDFVYYRYEPSLAAAAIFVSLFALASAIHLFQMIRTRTWFMIPFIIGAVLEAAGYVGRVLSANENPGPYTQLPFILQVVFLLIAPTFFAASIYMELGRIVLMVNGGAALFIRRTWLTKVRLA